MKTQLTITDLTRMQQGRVCLAGYTDEGLCVRPVLPPPGIPEGSLVQIGQGVICPFVRVEYDLVRHTPKPPHTEDHIYEPSSMRFVSHIKTQERRTLLERSYFASVSRIFEQPIKSDAGYYIQDGIGPRSLGTIRPKTIVKVIYTQGESGAWDYRLHFFDTENIFYRLKIVDLTWHHYCDSLRGPERQPQEIATQLTGMLKSKNISVLLRIGLSRGWKERPGVCYLQVTGIHTFPDYLNGMNFADFQ